MNQVIQPVTEHTVHLNPNDPVAIAKHDLQPGLTLVLSNGGLVVVREAVPAGHKLALSDLQADQVVLRYGQPIGRTTANIPAGSWVHTHNLAVGEISRQYSYKLAEPIQTQPSGRTFSGFRRSHGRAGTRNYIAIISTVNCSAHVASQIARAFTTERLAGYENIDGVIPIIHHTGCGMPLGGLSYTYLKRMLANLAFHPNIGAAVYVGLGSEVNQIADCQPLYSTEEMEQLGPLGLVIQDQGGFRKTVAAGIDAVEELLPRVNAVKRTPQPLSELVVALQCGGSDGWSGVTANPWSVM
jgi:altronate hydrolase